MERSPHWGCISFDEARGGKEFMEWEALSGQTLVCVVTGLKRSKNYNMLWKIYKKMILTLQEKALHR